MKPAWPRRGTVIAAAAVVVPSGVLRPGWMLVDDDLIRAVVQGLPYRTPDVDLGEGWLVPGFVDLHVHGGGGADMASGRSESVRRAVALHRSHGTTTMLASLVTAELADLHASVQRLADLADDGLVAGIHLEGPWLAPGRPGAHDPRLLRTPTPADVDTLLRLGHGHVKSVTVAPELDGGLDAIRRIAGAGALAAVGHTDADYVRTWEAVEAGARLATHLFNAMPPVHHREPGPVAALLESNAVAVELVLDGVHLHPAVAALAADRAGPDRTVLVTDAMAAAGAPDGDYALGAREVRVSGGVARLAESGELAGSTLTMDAAWRSAVLDLSLSPQDASRAASTTPARLLGLEDVTGALVPGLRADLVAMDSSLEVQRVMAGGGWLPDRDDSRP